MTDREKCIVTAYTGVLMTDWSTFHGWVEDFMDQPVYTHEFALEHFTDNLKRKVKPLFFDLCGEDTGWRTFDEKDVTTWPEFNEKVLVLSSNQEFIVREFYVSQGLPFWTDGDTIIANHSIKAWMPIPDIPEEVE